MRLNRLPKVPGRREVDAEFFSELARRIERLRPDHRDPHRFHEEKSEIAHELTKLARRVA
jgi:hypothetical protein